MHCRNSRLANVGPAAGLGAPIAGPAQRNGLNGDPAKVCCTVYNHRFPPLRHSAAMHQPQLFTEETALPSGMSYEPDFLSVSEEAALLQVVKALPFSEAQYKEWTARRRVVSYGGRFDFSRNVLLAADPIPPFLHPLRQRVANWSGIAASKINHALLSEYSPGTPLGWHRDAPNFEVVVGVSLGGSGRMRLRPFPPAMNSRAALVLDVEPRSIYQLQGAARWDWQHAISPARHLRYSITFRTLVG